jgi:Ca2+-binding RTX toxin-like protein
MPIIYGTNSGNTLDGGAADDEIFGWAEANPPGNQGPAGDSDLLRGEGGDDTLNGGNGTDTLYGGDARDDVLGGAGADLLYGGDGNDNLYGGFAVDGAGDARDTLYGGNGGDFLLGRAGGDLIYGGAGADDLNGGTGNDVIFGGDGNDRIDLLMGLSDGRDMLDGGTGRDRLVYSAAGSGRDWKVTFVAGAEGGKLGPVTYKNFEALDFTGGSGSDTVTGAAAADRLLGGSGSDLLRGGGGNDFISGNAGNDVLTGGAGVDTFQFSGPLGSIGVDQITDYTSGQDVILLSFVDFAIGSPMTAAFRLGTAAQDANDRLIYDRPTGRLFYDLDGNGAGTKVLFVKLDAGTLLRAADFDIFGIA